MSRLHRCHWVTGILGVVMMAMSGCASGDKCGGYEFFELIRNSRYAEMERYLSACPDAVRVSSETSKGWLPIHSAAAANDIRLGRMLLAHGTSLVVRDGQLGESPYQIAKRYGHQDFMQWLRMKGVTQ